MEAARDHDSLQAAKGPQRRPEAQAPFRFRICCVPSKRKPKPRARANNPLTATLSRFPPPALLSSLLPSLRPSL